MASFRANSHVLGYRPGEVFDLGPEDDLDLVAAYVAGGHLTEFAPAPEEEAVEEEAPEEEAVDLDSATLRDLRPYAERLGVDPSGKRGELVDRLRAHLDEFPEED